MKLKSFGCSFIFGSDLSDETPGEPYDRSCQSTWPALLAKHFGWDYECHARPGSGNLRIAEKILSVAPLEPAVFVIGWSWIDRFDYTVDSATSDHVSDRAGTADKWNTILPTDIDNKSKSYYRNLHSQYRDKLTSLIYIKTCIDNLQQKNIPFVMTYIDDLLFETEWHCNSAILDLQNYVRPHMTQFDGKTFLGFSQYNGFPISDRSHPLEQAHQAAYELIKSYNLL